MTMPVFVSSIVEDDDDCGKCGFQAMWAITIVVKDRITHILTTEIFKTCNDHIADVFVRAHDL